MSQMDSNGIYFDDELDMSINKKPTNAKKQKRDKIGSLLKTKLSQDCRETVGAGFLAIVHSVEAM